MAPSSFLRFSRRQLPNGLGVLVSENYRLPLLSIHAFVRTGSDQNPEDRPGLASLTARLLDEGTRSYPASQIAEMVENAGGSLSILSQRELTAISLHLKAQDLKWGLELLREMICFPVFPEERIELEREKVLSHLQAMADDPQLVASQALNGLIYSGTPLQYPILGTPESISALRREELVRFHGEKYGPQNTLLVSVGAGAANEVTALVEDLFSDWNSPDFRRTEIHFLRRQTEPRFEFRHMEREQINIFLGHLGITRSHPDFHALQLMDVILGSGPGFTSRIPRFLRDEQGLAYTTYSDLSGSAGIYPGRFVAFIHTSPQNARKALSGLLEEIRKLVEEGVTEEEISLAQDYLTGSFVFDFQSNTSVARSLLEMELFGLGADYPQRYPAVIRSTTREEVNRVARLHLDTVNYSTVVVGSVHETKLGDFGVEGRA